MSDLLDGNQSRLIAAHNYLRENDRFYRAGLVAASVSLAVAVVASVALFVWSPSVPLPPPAVPAAPAAPQSHGQPGAPGAAPIPQGHAPQAPAQTVDLKALRDRATIDAAAFNDLRTRAEAGDRLAQFYVATLYDPKIANINFQKDAATAVGWYLKSAD